MHYSHLFSFSSTVLPLRARSTKNRLTLPLHASQRKPHASDRRKKRHPCTLGPLHCSRISIMPHASLPFFFCSTFNSSARLICGRTPPKAIVARINVSSSSSPRMASCRWRGVMRLTLRSLAALPASSRTSAVRYSRTAVT